MASMVQRMMRCQTSNFIIKQVLRPSQFQTCRCMCATLQRDRRWTNIVAGSTLHGQSMYETNYAQMRHMSGGRRNFFADFVENIKQEMKKNKELKENLKKFREEADKLEQSDALKKAREKYESIESETSKGSEALKETFSSIKGKVKEQMEEVEKSDIGKKGKEFFEEAGKAAGKAAETMAKSGQTIGESQVFKSVASGVKTVKKEIDDVTLSRVTMYKAPEKLRKRRDGMLEMSESKTVEANEDATGIVMHKDSKWFQSWQNFKDNNQLVNKMFDMKTKYDESDNLMVRATRAFTDKVTDLFGGMFTKTEMSEVLTEIVKMDPNFDKEIFIKDCKTDIIPNVLEALVRGDLEILEDWCHEGVYNMLAHPIKQGLSVGHRIDSKVLDINHVDIAAGKMTEQGPVLVITFFAQQIMVARDAKGNVVEGDENKLQRIMHVWALCRDPEILDPKAAWRIMDLSFTAQEQFL